MEEIMKISVQTAPWFKYDDPDTSFAFIKECGFDAVDFNIDILFPARALARGEGDLRFFDMSIDEVVEYHRPVKEAADKHGISFAQMHAPFPLYFDGLTEVNEKLVESVVKCLAVCALFGCPALIVHPLSFPSEPYEKEVEVNLALYRSLIPAAKKYGVTVCLENMFYTYNDRRIGASCASAEESVWYIDKLNEEAGEEIFGYCFDLGHANIVGENVKRFLNTLGHRLTVLHVHDNDGAYDLHTLPYACLKKSGPVCNWDEFLEGLRDIGYEGPINFETFNALRVFPKEVWPETLKLISAIGRMFDARIHS